MTNSEPPASYYEEGGASALEPLRFQPPNKDADPEAVAVYVAGVWGNRAAGDPPWYLTAEDWITPDFRQFLHATAPQRTTFSVAVRSFVVDVVMVDVHLSTTVVVSLEQTTAVAGVTDPEPTIVVIELILIGSDTGWLVASLERK